MTEQPGAEPGPQEEPEIDWRHVVSWPSLAHELMKDIEGIRGALALMEGTADDQACQVFADFLRTALTAQQQRLALLILELHGVDLPEPGTMPTPQERMSAQLRHVADEVRKRRADIIPPEQPYTERRRGRHPGMPHPPEEMNGPDQPPK